MAAYDREFLQKQQEFYDEMGAIKGKSAANEMLYICAHTVYLKDGINYKDEIFKMWRENFRPRLGRDSWRYLRDLYPSFISVGLIESIKKGSPTLYEATKLKTLIRLEMDVELIKCAESKVPFTMETFCELINKKYNSAFENILDEIKNFDVPYIKNFSNIEKALLLYKSDIQKLYDNFIKSYNESIQRYVSDKKHVTPRAEKISITPTPATETVTVTTIATVPVDEEKIVPEPASETDNVVAKYEEKIRYYEDVIAEYEEKIKRLESDVTNYQRRHDELREFSASQYDRGVKDLFNILNDKRYSKPIELLYRLSHNKNLDDNFRSYLENLFLALESMDIEPMIQMGQTVTIEPARLATDYNLEFDKKDYVPAKTFIKYVGWKYKNSPIEKPTLAKNP